MVRLISCLPDSNRNSVGEYVRMNGNWLNGELSSPTSPCEIGRYSLLPITKRMCLPSPFDLLMCLLSFTCYSFLLFFYFLSISLIRPPPLIVVSKKFKSDISVVHVRELNFILRSEIFVHFVGQLRAFHLILGCVPSYTSYQDSSNTLMIGNPLLSYLDVWLLGFLPPGLNSEEARHLSPRLIRHDSLEPIPDDSKDNIFQGQVVHIPVEAPILGDTNKEGPIAEDAHPEEPILPNQAKEMVQK